MLSLAGPAHYEERVRRSRFLAQVAPVAGEAETLAFYESVADPSATHNCWAWRLEAKYRFSDDGEPGGTAGRPMLAVLEGRGLHGVMVVVTRWFGGIKLGAGGLSRAYAGVTAMALDRAEVVPVFSTVTATLAAAFADANAAHQCLAQFGATDLQENYVADGSRMTFEIRADRFEALRSRLRDASSGRIRIMLKKSGSA